jgi:hypothetical protein
LFNSPPSMRHSPSRTGGMRPRIEIEHRTEGPTPVDDLLARDHVGGRRRKTRLPDGRRVRPGCAPPRPACKRRAVPCTCVPPRRRPESSPNERRRIYMPHRKHRAGRAPIPNLPAIDAQPVTS